MIHHMEASGASERRIVSVDIGGTHARFALATIADGRVLSLGEAVTLKTADHASLQTAWEEFGRQLGGPLPDGAAIAIAGPISGDVIKLTNNPWVIRPALIPDRLGARDYVVVNDFEAVGHAVAQCPDQDFSHITGPTAPLPEAGLITVVGPGTGLGVAHVLRHGGGRYHVQPTEGGHIDFAPLDGIDDALLARLRNRHRRVSVERVVSGPGIVDIYEALAAIEGRAVLSLDDKAVWTMAFDGSDSIAVAALDRFCMSLGSVAGDLALAQGASAVVVAGGLGLRLLPHLAQSAFDDRFRFKGRFEKIMAAMPVKLITHPQPGLFGAASAFAQAARA